MKRIIINIKTEMKITSVNEYGEVVLEEVYNPIILRTKEGVEYTICMRDYGLEIHESRNYHLANFHRPVRPPPQSI